MPPHSSPTVLGDGALELRIISITSVERLESIIWFPSGTRFNASRSPARFQIDPSTLWTAISQSVLSRRDTRSEKQTQASQNVDTELCILERPKCNLLSENSKSDQILVLNIHVSVTRLLFVVVLYS